MLAKKFQDLCTEYYCRFKRAKAVIHFGEIRLTGLQNLAKRDVTKARKSYS